MFPVLADPELYVYLPLDAPESVDSLTERYARLARGYPETDDEIWLNWIVRERTSGACVGYVQATIYEDLSCDLAYLLRTAAWGNGYATEACEAVLPELWTEYDVDRVEITLDNRNLRGARVAERLGFVLDRIADAQDYHTGRPTEEVVLVLHRPLKVGVSDGAR
jgi:RimJ/RimL family protein N-acetyltransferase